MLAPGTILGPYKILAPLGAGGMGEVYRAHDSRLGRDVAIKVLPPHLSATPEVRARFEREARTISQLNHPHICTLHDVGHQDGVDYLVMELVAGESLAQRLQKGPLPTADVLRIGAQIADALDRAHRAGVIHRDLKPGNVMLAKSGAKLMDFGLARTSAPIQQASAPAESPTMSRSLTAEGTILGTLQYMAPEQLEGKEADARSDIWALGCVLYEMATGAKAFEGKSQASLIAAIMEHEPRSMTGLRPLTPPGLERIVKRCLEKSPEDRLQSARDVAFDLDGVDGSASGATSAAGGMSASEPKRFGLRALLVALLLPVLLAVAVIVALPRLWRAAIPAPVRFSIAPPSGGHALTEGYGSGETAISPDGRAVAFRALDSLGTFHIWVRQMDEIAPRMITGTENALFPIWSPDGRYLAFSADGKLRKVRLDGGGVEVVCAAPGMRGGAWSADGTIVFAPSPDGPLFKVSDAGGTPVAVTALDSTRLETAHRFPTFLADGRHFIFVALPPRLGRYSIQVGSVDGTKPKKVLESDGGAIFAAPGWIIYLRGTGLMAQRFNSRALKLEGEPLALADSPGRGGTAGIPGVSASRNGALAYAPWAAPNNDLAWYGHDGRSLGRVPVAPGPFTAVVPSPDGLYFAATRSVTPEQSEIWLLDGVRGIASRVCDVPGANGDPRWSPDGGSIMYGSDRNGPVAFYMVDASGTAPESLVFAAPGSLKGLLAWPASHDGVLFNQWDVATGGDIWWLPLHGDRKPIPMVRTPANEGNLADVSPDGQWLLYDSDVTGRPELFARLFAGGREVQVTTSGSFNGFWGRNGREILSVGQDNRTVTAIPFEPGSPPRVGVPHVLFKAPERTISVWYDTPRDRFLVVRPATLREPLSVTVLLNWTAALKKP